MALGILLSLAAAGLIGVSFFYQRVGLRKIGAFDLKRVLLSRDWQLGLVIGVVAFVLYLLALRAEKVAIVQPLMNTSVIFSIGLGHFVLHEKASRHELAGIALVLAGIVLILFR